MSVSVIRPEGRQTFVLSRVMCLCGRPVLRVQFPGRLIVAEIYEWEPRATCQRCQRTRRDPRCFGRLVSCSRCNDTGYVGSERPEGLMLALDVAWDDDGHARIIGPLTSRRKGEALHPLHACSLRVAA